MKLTLNALMAKYSITARELSLLFNIPRRTIDSWRAETRIPPMYVLNMIDFILGHLTERSFDIWQRDDHEEN